MCGLTPAWALPALLLSATSLETDAEASRWIVDGWLLICLYDDSGPRVRHKTRPKMLRGEVQLPGLSLFSSYIRFKPLQFIPGLSLFSSYQPNSGV